MSCSGVKEPSEGIDYCGKVIDETNDIKLYFERSKQIHDLHFCSFKCLRLWLKYSFWEMNENRNN